MRIVSDWSIERWEMSERRTSESDSWEGRVEVERGGEGFLGTSNALTSGYEGVWER